MDDKKTSSKNYIEKAEERAFVPENPLRLGSRKIILAILQNLDNILLGICLIVIESLAGNS